MRLIYEDAFYIVEEHGEDRPGEHHLYAKRTDRGYSSVEEIRTTFEAAIAVLEPAAERVPRLILDLRLAPGRNDPAFESIAATYRPQIYARFPVTSIVVKTAIGAMQVQRHMREDGRPDITVVRELADALRAVTVPS